MWTRDTNRRSFFDHLTALQAGTIHNALCSDVRKRWPRMIAVEFVHDGDVNKPYPEAC